MVIHGDTMGNLLEIHGGLTHIKPRFFYGDMMVFNGTYPAW